MKYLLPNISSRDHVSESVKLYEIDLVRQWFDISPGTIIETANSCKITVINTGISNKHEGPDIKDAILIINDKVVIGSIECHISTSDWYKHKHNKNTAYKSVILHVVRKFNGGIIRPAIPTVLLKPEIHFSNKCSLNNINKCSHLIDTILHFSYNRWLDKINMYNGYHDSQKQLIKVLLSNSFRILGAGGNEQQFVKLAKNINYKKIRNLTLRQCEKYLWNKSLLLKIRWVKRSIRPAQQPQNRMKLATELIHYFASLEYCRLPNYDKVESSILNYLPSASGNGIQTEILGNVLIPFYAARALYFNKVEDYKNYHERWNQLKLSNSYRKFVKRFGVNLQSSQLKSFSILQGLIAIDNNLCSKNLCHLCPLKENNYAVS